MNQLSSMNATVKKPWIAHRATGDDGRDRERDESIDEAGVTVREILPVASSSASRSGTLSAPSSRTPGLSSKRENGSVSGSATALEGIDEAKRVREAMIIELLSGEAQFEVQSFEVMEYDEMERVKRVRSFRRTPSYTSRMRY